VGKGREGEYWGVGKIEKDHSIAGGGKSYMKTDSGHRLCRGRLGMKEGKKGGAREDLGCLDCLPQKKIYCTLRGGRNVEKGLKGGVILKEKQIRLLMRTN